jgi:acetylornithine deacetylase
VRGIALLFVVGGSAGGVHGAPRGSHYLINGEPTENRLALGSKGALRYEFTARGRMAHSAYPELGESAIEKMLDVLERVRRIPLPVDPVLGASTVNIGTLNGGRAPNVIADHARPRS